MNVFGVLGRLQGSQCGWSTTREGRVVGKGVEKVASTQAVWCLSPTLKTYSKGNDK